jgi:hypothetical protein
MSKVLEEITREIINLPREQRMALAGFLLELDEHDDESEARASWEQEILARIRAVDDGTAIGVSYDEVMRSAQSRLP